MFIILDLCFCLKQQGGLYVLTLAEKVGGMKACCLKLQYELYYTDLGREGWGYEGLLTL